MTFSEIIALDRGLLDDEILPYKWKDAELVACANQTINELCEKARIIIDSTTPAICNVPLLAGTAKYAKDSRIIEILRGRMVTYDCKITRRTGSFMDNYSSGWDSATASTGTPRNFLEDLDTGYFTLTPAPDANDTLWLTVVRLPLDQMTLADLTNGASPEIHFKHHYALSDGILARAYLKQDAETYDPKKSARHMQIWLNYVNQVMLDEINRNDIDNQADQVPDYLED